MAPRMIRPGACQRPTPRPGFPIRGVSARLPGPGRAFCPGLWQIGRSPKNRAMPQLRKLFGEARARVLADLGSGDLRLVAGRYLPGAFAGGLVLGCILGSGSALGALLVLAMGGVVGYGVRSYVSHRRRQRFLAERG